MKKVKLEVIDSVLIVVAIMSAAVISGILFVTRDFSETVFWGTIALSALSWFYISVLLAGLTILYAKHQFFVGLGYLGSLVFFLILTLTGGEYIYSGMVWFFTIIAYLLTIFIFKFFVTAELQRQQNTRASVRDLVTLLLPFLSSVVLIYGGLLSAALGQESIITITLLPERQLTVSWLLISNYAYLAVLGLGLGYWGRLPFSISIIAGLSLASEALLFNLIMLQEHSEWLILFACFFIPFIVANIVKFFWIHRYHEGNQ